ncbi:Adapter molecule Crk [Frankliniella fusca]|uniref:Adapter molecule Crk n=1 Tax=Frankliniella fusca TaxID=407009 RepID=A0AAE1LU15_9NEOP|nr:Adapter molecule Crk [Frankliniella fusca]
MAATFEPYDRDSWYFGQMSRQDATDLLMGEREGGVFLVRDSNSIHGDFVLCVREDSKVSHYIINKLQQGDQTRYRIGDQTFPDLPSLLSFYKVHYLDTTPLIRPAPRRIEKVMARYDFEGSDPDDLPFIKGEVLTVVQKDEDQWWTARNSVGQTGSIPVPYVQKYEENQLGDGQRPGSGGGNPIPVQQETTIKRTNIQRKLPAFAQQLANEQANGKAMAGSPDRPRPAPFVLHHPRGQRTPYLHGREQERAALVLEGVLRLHPVLLHGLLALASLVLGLKFLKLPCGQAAPWRHVQGTAGRVEEVEQAAHVQLEARDHAAALLVHLDDARHGHLALGNPGSLAHLWVQQNRGRGIVKRQHFNPVVATLRCNGKFK